jgi:hypothetical protein
MSRVARAIPPFVARRLETWARAGSIERLRAWDRAAKAERRLDD